MRFGPEDEAPEPTPWAVICPIHGRVYLTKEFYLRCMDAADEGWICPRYDRDLDNFGPCGAEAGFDDDNWERHCDICGQPTDRHAGWCGDHPSNR